MPVGHFCTLGRRLWQARERASRSQWECVKRQKSKSLGPTIGSLRVAREPEGDEGELLAEGRPKGGPKQAKGEPKEAKGEQKGGKGNMEKGKPTTNPLPSRTNRH